MTTSKKVPNWTQAQLDAIESRFEKDGALSNEVVKVMLTEPLFAAKKLTSLRMKVVNMGYYKKAVAKTAADNGKPATTRKIEYVEALQTLTGIKDLSSFEKASKPQLEAVCHALTALSDTAHADSGVKEPVFTPENS